MHTLPLTLIFLVLYLVWQGTSVETKKSYAIKVVDRTGLSQAEDGAVLNEVAILKSLRHKHIVPLLDFFEDPVSENHKKSVTLLYRFQFDFSQ